MLYDRSDLVDYQNVTIRLLIDNPYIGASNLLPLVARLGEEFHIHLEYRGDWMTYEKNENILRTTGKLVAGVPDCAVKAIRKKRHGFRTEYILDIHYALDETITFGPFD